MQVGTPVVRVTARPHYGVQGWSSAVGGQLLFRLGLSPEGDTAGLLGLGRKGGATEISSPGRGAERAPLLRNTWCCVHCWWVLFTISTSIIVT